MGAGCEECLGTGYHGRMALFEQFVPDDKIKQLIVERRSAIDIDEALKESDMLTLERSGKLAALEGSTTMEELVRVLPIV